MATKFYNLIILDRSGSMTTIRQAAVAGVNETLGTIRKIGKETESQQLVSLLAFCGCSKEYIIRDKDIHRVGPLTLADYQPCCSTPLYDAIGAGCTALRKLVGNDPEARVSVTIITDGYENSSSEWTQPAVAALIKELKAQGWLFAFIGANIDVKKVSFTLSIDNSISFQADEEGTQQMFDKECRARSRWARTAASAPADAAPMNDGYFDDLD